MGLPVRTADRVFEEIIQGLSEEERKKARGRKIKTVEQ